jgi:hypothetical protein
MSKLYKRDCYKCSGTGVLPHYRSVFNGSCFSCSGAGYRLVKTDPAILDARNAKAAEKREAKREAERQAYIKRNFWRRIGNGIRDAVWEAQRQAEHLAAEPIIEGKQVILGNVLTVREQNSDWGWTIKMLVKDDRGFKLWGSVASSILDQCDSLESLKGQRVTFTATLKASDDDDKFGFFKRPTKAAIAA